MNAEITITSSGVELTVEQGQPGIGVPAGGTTGQVLTKASNANYDTTWATGTGGGAVTSVTGTANEVTVSPTTGAVVVGLPDDITVRDVNVEHAKFDTTPTVTTAAQADMVWTDNLSTVSLGMSATVAAPLGQSIYKRGKNVSGSPIAKGKVVRIAGGTGSADLTFDLATNATEAGSAPTIGFAAETIADNSHGFVVCQGVLTGIDTSGYSMAEGQTMYLGAAGDVVGPSLPTQPAHGVFCGWLIKKAAGSAGVVYAKFDNYQELEELSDVLVGTTGGGTALANGDVLQYDGTVWRNRTLANAGAAPSGADYLVGSASSGLTAERVVQNSLTVTANLATPGQFSMERAALTGDVTASANSNTTTIANDAVTTAKILDANVTFAKVANVTASKVLGRGSAAGTGSMQELTLGTGLSMSGTTLNGTGGTVTSVIAGTGLTGGTITSSGTIAADVGTGSTQVAAGNHTHGNLTNDGKIGSSSGRVVVTTTAGAVTTLADGSASQFLQTNGAGVLSWASGSGGSITTYLDEFYDDTQIGGISTGTTWTKQTGCFAVYVECIGAGGGGANGGVGSGGIGGGSGGYASRWFRAADCGSTESISIGAGGAAGTNTVGGASAFGTLLSCSGARGQAVANLFSGERSTTSYGAGGAAAAGGRYGGYGSGGGGGGANTNTTAGSAGGLGYDFGFATTAPTAGGGSAGGAGTTGGAGTNSTVITGGFGRANGPGGGGGNNAGTGGAGGVGARGSGGGGGGSGSTAGGGGGGGGNGYVRVVQWCFT